MKTECYRMGIDVGSTTAKVVVVDRNAEIVYSAYRRHNAETLATLQHILHDLFKYCGNLGVQLLITGSAGLGISEKFKLPFIQEVVASAEVVSQLYPEVKTLIDIGGEDSKMIFFDAEGIPDIRMNGSCAGGTGAFIDEMAGLLNTPVAELSTLAENHTSLYPMASRCGVFAKTDVQNLLSREIAWEDIAASVFNAVVLQTLATLSRGSDPTPKILFSGGPLTFLPALRQSFSRVLKLREENILKAENSELLPALGAALADCAHRMELSLNQLQALLRQPPENIRSGQNNLSPLFVDQPDFQAWSAARTRLRVDRVALQALAGQPCFLGVDSGSTTTKLVLVDVQGRLAFDYYCNNNGDPITAVRTGLKQINQHFIDCEAPPIIKGSVVTGYGEDLMRTAFDFDEGMVETLAHFRAARAFDRDVSFILDIGGQDMKAIFVDHGHIQNIEINEACSSGCGTFIEAFARSTGYGVAEFGQIACQSAAPCDLGTRCTVFMNSKVKQALREGASVVDISAGLAYSVIKNALHKVLKIRDTASLGEHILVQGGTFRNPSIHKVIETLLRKQVMCPDIAELMGAYGAALTALDAYEGSGAGTNHTLELENLDHLGTYTKKTIHCRGCENRCAITKLVFENQNVFFTGNRCEKIFTNSGRADRKGTNLVALKYQLLFEREEAPVGPPHLRLGIPRVLNLFENYPFWHTLFGECGIQVHLSPASGNALYEKGVRSVMSENICFPAKLAHGHIIDLCEAGVDRIFYPMVFYEDREFSDSSNCYNCPIVSGYPDVIRSAINPEREFGIPLDMPAINFNHKGLLKKACYQYLSRLGIRASTIKRAFARAVEAQEEFKAEIRARGEEIVFQARREGRPVILLMGRPYQIDPMINHKVPEMLENFGVDIISEDGIPLALDQRLNSKNVLTQWEYSNRFYHAARWAGQQPDVEVVFLNSFGCGPDAYVVDEVKSILQEHGKGLTVIRIDEVESPGSIKLRLRTMIELLNKNGTARAAGYDARKKVKVFEESDLQKTIIVPDFAAFCTPPILRAVADFGFNLEALPPSNRQSVEVGLKYVNNEICYPGIIVIGDVIKALQSGKYDPSNLAIGFWETGGQCRASNILYGLKRALLAAGFENTPVITISTNTKPVNEQPGFKIETRPLIIKAILAIAFSDAISTMYHATAIRETHKGQALRLANHYLRWLDEGRITLNKAAILETLATAVADFNDLATQDREFPLVGIVGEIYLKYNAFGNNELVDWLMDQEIEVLVPPLLEFFSGSIVGMRVGVRANLRKHDLLWLLTFLADKLLHDFLDQADAVMQDFRYYRHGHTIHDIAKLAGEVVALTHQYGESWLIAGEISAFAREGVHNVLCLQPFGCIANHVVAKGIGKGIKDKYPQLNLLFLDTDAGLSEVNYFNRLHFFVNHAKTYQRSHPAAYGVLH